MKKLRYSNKEIDWEVVKDLLESDWNFKNILQDTIFYALDNHHEKRGSGACDALFLELEYKDIILKTKGE